MLVLFNGKERTVREFIELGNSTGWKLESVKPGLMNALVFSATQAGVDGAKIRTVRPYFVAFCVADWSRADTAPRR